jgi:aspartate-semialdehyde dehydrogenase
VNLERLRKAPNIAIVGSSSPLGKELKEMIEDSEFPIGRRALLETEDYAGLLQEFAGEIQITQIISPNAFADIDIAFFACSPEIMDAYSASGAPFPELTIDLTQTNREGALFLSGVSDPGILKNNSYVVNPHPAAIVLVRVLSRLHRSFGIQAASVNILQPASERGSAGVDELQEQTVGLLNFQQVKSRVFDGQLAFNILSEMKTSERLEGLIRRQIRTILGEPIPAPAIVVVQAPVFHSHAFSLFVNLQGSPSPEEIRSSFAQDRTTVSVHSDPKDAPSPVGVVGTDTIHLGRVSVDPARPGAYWLWLVADNLRIAAANALQTAESIMFAPATQS